MKEVNAMDEVVQLKGPVLKRDGQLMLLIPLEDGGVEFVECSRGISEVENGCLKIVIEEWLAGLLRIAEGDMVVISNTNGKFGIRPSQSRVVH